MILKVVLLIALIRLLIATEKPFLCSAIYAGFVTVFALVNKSPTQQVLIAAGVAFGLSSLYFWLLNRFGDGGLFWVIMVLGILIGLV